MRQRSYSFVRAHRRRLGLTQAELAALLGVASPTTVSRIERSKRMPTTPVVIACCVLFGLPTPELFTSLYEEIEEIVGTAAKALHEELEGRIDKQSDRKREFLEEVLARVINRNKSKEI